MADIIDRVADLLYPDQGPTTADIKFFREPGALNISAEDLARLIHLAMLQVSRGVARPVSDLSGC